MVEPISVSIMAATACLHILTEIVTHEARSHDDYVAKWHGKPINHDLQKALKRSFFSALQKITSDCQKEYPKKSQSQVWLALKFKELATQLKEFSPLEDERERLFDSLDHLQFFLVLDPQLAKEVNPDDVRKRLIDFALAKATEAPECYTTQIEQRLFEEVRDYFIREVKQNEPVHNILMAGSQAEMTAKINRLERGQAEMMKLLTELRDFKATTSWQAKIKLDIDLASDLFDDQILAVIKTMRQQGLKTLRVEAGSVVIVAEGSETAIRQLENLTEIAGCRVEKLVIIPGYPLPETPTISLLKWLQKQFEEAVATGWQTLDEIFGPSELAFKFRANKIQRAKELDLGNGVLLVLLIQVCEEKDDDVRVTLEVRAKDKGTLPIGLTLSVFQDTGESRTTQASEGDYLQQEWLFSLKETFTVTLTLGEIQVTEKFSI